MPNKIYNEDSTQHISPREFTRKRPGTYCGSTEYSTQLVRELFANALDEHNIGHGNVISIEADTKKNLYTVTDLGQGFIPGAPRENGETMFSECFSVINTSGKYDDADDSIYGGSALGLNGIGMKLVCYLSSWSQATTTNGSGKRETITYKDGLFESRQITDEKKDIHGTTISYQPDPQFFQHQEANFDELRKMFTDIAALCPMLTIELTIDGKKEIFHSSRGLNDLIDAKVGNNEILSNRFIARRESGADLFDICLTYTSNYSEDVTGYVNFGLTESGVHMTALRTNLTRLINKFANDKKLFKAGESNLTGQELSEGLVIIFNLKAKKVAYDSQSKVRVVDIDKTLINQTLSEDFAQWLESNQKDVKIIIDKAINARKAREAAKKARDNARVDKKKKEKALKFDSKLADCYSKTRSKCEIYVTEGDSASGNLKAARNNEFQAVMPVRGKILNTQKAALDKIQKNAEIMTMIEAFGLKTDAKTMKLTYDKSDLRYGKIIIAADADVDGAHIRNLFYTFIWNFCPQLIEEGYVYSLVAPLYKITMGKDTYLYLKDDAALAEFSEKHKGKKYTVSRFKGLGEMSEDETEVLVDPEQRMLCQVTVSDAKAADILFDQLMGTGVGARKKYIQDHSQEAKYNI